MRSITLTLTDAMYHFLELRAVVEGDRRSNRSGVQSVVIKASRAYLNQNKVPVSILDMDDAEFAKYYERQERESKAGENAD